MISISEFIKNNILILDGATGTELQKAGMPTSVCPEKWILENPEALIKLQSEYVQAGANAVLVPSFGGNRIKLKNYDLVDKLEEININLVQLSKKAVNGKAYVLGDMSTTGKFVEPFGKLSFEECVNIYKEQAKALLKGGVDGFFVETMIDIQETRAALLAIKELTDKFTFISMTYDENGYTLTGTDPVTATISLQALGADAVGMNCSTGPDKMCKFVEKIKKVAKVPIFAKPNAGLPKLVNNKTTFDMEPKEFGNYLQSFYDAGVNAFGGCCGTTKNHIKVVSDFFKTKEVIKPLLDKNPSAVTSSRKTTFLGPKHNFAIIGERINPTGKKLLKEELKNGKRNLVKKFAVEQNLAGANILDINVGVPGIDEKRTMDDVTKILAKLVDTPLCIDSSDPDLFEDILRKYPGRALINSISAEKEKYEKLLPIAAKYGSMFILLPLNEKGIPKTVEKRIDLVNEVYKKCKDVGLTKNDIVLDGLVMTISTGHEPGKTTLDLIQWASNTFKVNTTMGLSNVSFGLPNRPLINTNYLSMSAAVGLTTAIINPNIDEMRNSIYAINAIRGTDRNSLQYINQFNNTTTTKKEETNIKLSTDKKVYKMIVDGNEDDLDKLTQELVDTGNKPDYIVNSILIPAIREVGDLYDKKIYFLPQLMMSAKAMQKAFKVVEPLIRADATQSTGKIVIATVKGDIHDIGKNIVVLMLQNNGFDVIDMGKDIESKLIVDKAEQEGADIICLSALMTTTMTKMPEVINIVKKRKLNIKIMIGGAVVDKEYAQEIGADGYSDDAAAAAVLALNLLKKNN